MEQGFQGKIGTVSWNFGDYIDSGDEAIVSDFHRQTAVNRLKDSITPEQRPRVGPEYG